MINMLTIVVGFRWILYSWRSNLSHTVFIFSRLHSLYFCARTHYIHVGALNIFVRAHSIYSCARTHYIHLRAHIIWTRAHAFYWCARTHYVYARARIIFMRAPICALTHHIFARTHRMFLWTCTHTWMFLDPYLWFFALTYRFCVFLWQYSWFYCRQNFKSMM